MTPDISTGIVGAQVVLIVVSLIAGVAAKQRQLSIVFAWICSLLALVAVGLAVIALIAPKLLGITEGTSSFVVYGVTAFIAATIAWAVLAVVNIRLRSVQERYYAKPETREALAHELREVLHAEGVQLDERLARAEQEREQFLFALEDQHARHIRGLADEYQHESATILRQLIEQISAERLEPMVAEQLAVKTAEIEREIARIDQNAVGAELSSIRSEYGELSSELEIAAKRIEELRSQNPDLDLEDQAAARLAKVDAQVEIKMSEIAQTLDSASAERMAAFEARMQDIDSLLNAKVESAGNPLVAKMAETQSAVEEQLASWMGVLDGRFSETEQILNQRIVEQESALEARVVQLEESIEQRLAQHVAAIEQVLAGHDSQLQSALHEQSGAISKHFSDERDRLIAELTEHGAQIQQAVAGELASAEDRARGTVEATQTAWNSFTDELEQRFAETREQAIDAAKEIAQEERSALQVELAKLTSDASGEIASQVESLGREAAWQRNQVERSVRETIEVLQGKAQEAIADADVLFADLERIGAERVDRIKHEAEQALIQSRDYVDQLQDSLGTHLEQLRERSGVVADEMNDRMSAIAAASHDGASQLEQYARDLVEATTRELSSTAERATGDLQQRINQEFAATITASMDAQQRRFDSHMGEVAQRLMQQVQGDLAGLAEHARAAVTGELDQIIAQSRQHAIDSQEQSFRAVMNDLAKQQTDLASQARLAGDDARRTLENGIRDNRRQLEEAMASMGAHMREELVRFHDEGQRRVEAVITKLRTTEQDLIRDEDRKLASARQELVRQHQGALEQQVRSFVGGLSTSMDLGSSSESGGSFTDGLSRPSTPLSPGGSSF